MTPSIRTFLLINLLLSVTLITSLAIIGNLFLEHRDIQTQLDSQLVRNGMQMQALFSDGVANRDLEIVQRNIQTALIISSKPREKSIDGIPQKAAKNFNERMSFQIWDQHGTQLLHSTSEPKGVTAQPLSNGKVGLSTTIINGKSWRVDTTYNKDSKLTIMVAERSDFRQELENQLTQDSIFIMLITYPFLGILIWIIVGRGLDTLKRVANEVRHRAPSYLEPVDLDAVPSEVEPLVGELNSLFVRLQEAFEREKRFASDAAHELKTPLAALNTQAQVAMQADSLPDIKDALGKVLKGVQRATHVVSQLLTLSRMVPQATLNNLTRLDLGRQIGEIAADIAMAAIAKDIDLELIAAEKPVRIQGNTTSIAILARNLLDNAIRYTPEEGKIKIRVFEDAQGCHLSVADNGPGIPEELRKRVFERFFRIMGNTTTGSGLGLGIVLQIVKLHNAKIDLNTSDWGNGVKQGLDVHIVFPKVI